MNPNIHEQIAGALERLDSTLDAAELHGMLCGLLCASPSNRAKARWFSELLDSCSLAADEFERHGEDLKLLERLFDGTVSDLNAADLTFELLLPAESMSLVDRTRGLASWCSGMSIGVGLGIGATRGEAKDLPADTSELLTDFSAIAAAGAEDETDDEESAEESLLALQEYVRMGVLLINEELSPAVVPQKRLH